MPGKNWDSRTGTWSPIVGDRANALATRARKLYARGWSIAAIAKELGRSESRIREYLR